MGEKCGDKKCVLPGVSKYLNLSLYLPSDPPGKPNITGLSHGQVLREGEILRLNCISMGGNPLADLSWFRGDQKVPGTATVKDEENEYSKSELVIIANRTDNGLDYRCEASNPAASEPR